MGQGATGSAQQACDAVVDGQPRAGQHQEDGAEQEVPRVPSDSCEPIMIAPPAISAPTSMSAAAQVRALEFNVLVNPAKGSCAKAGTWPTSTVTSTSPKIRISFRRWPIEVLPFANNVPASGDPVLGESRMRPSVCS